jgi:hypothetical protein
MYGHAFSIVRLVGVSKPDPIADWYCRREVAGFIDSNDFDRFAVFAVVSDISDVQARTHTVSRTGAQTQCLRIQRIETGQTYWLDVRTIQRRYVKIARRTGIIDVVKPFELPGRGNAAGFLEWSLKLPDLNGFFPFAANLGGGWISYEAYQTEQHDPINSLNRGDLLYTEIMRNKSGSPAHAFYAEVLKILKESKFTFMVAGGFAVNAYTGLRRPTKDIDIFVKAGDYPKILNKFASLGFKTQVQDERWIAKIFKGKFYVDLIFGSSNLIAPVTDDWFKDSHTAKFFNHEVKIASVTDLIWSKVFIQNRERYDGADVAHLILLRHQEINWERLLCSMEQYWEVLLIHLLNFRFIYPSEREKIPSWVMRELLSRLEHQFELPTPRMKVCRGRMFSIADYTQDVTELGFADLVGGENERRERKAG